MNLVMSLAAESFVLHVSDVPGPDRLTIDATVAHDFIKPSRERHALARKLFKLARAGVVEISTAPQGYRIDAAGDLATQLGSAFDIEHVSEEFQVAYPSEGTYPTEDPWLVPDPAFGQAWDAIVNDWHSHEWTPPGDADRFHVETHVLARRDVFLTDDAPLLVMCRRLQDEHGISVVAMRLGEYLAARAP